MCLNFGKYIKQFFIILLVLVFFGIGTNIFAQDDVTNVIASACPQYTFSVEGLGNIKKGIEQNYVIKIQGLGKSKTIPNISYELRQDKDVLLNGTGESFVYTFDTEGEYLLKIIGKSGTICYSEYEYPIHVYNKIYSYIGPTIEEFTLAHEGMTNSGIYIKEFFLLNNISTDQLTKMLAENVYYLEHADVLFLESSAISSFFETLTTLQTLIGFTIHDLDLYVLADINQSAFRRMLARYHSVMGLEKIYVVEKQYMGSLFTSLFLDKDLSSSNFIKTYAVSLEYSNKFLVVSYLVDYLLQHEFPIGTLLFILMLPLLVLLISIFRQVVGLSIFGVFNPLLFALSLHIMGTQLTLIFFIAAFFATILMRMFIKKIYLLYSAKISLLVVLYSILSLVSLRSVHYFGWMIMDYSLFKNIYIIFPFLFLIMVSDRVFSEKFYLFNTGRWVGLVEFLIVSGIIYRVISSLRVQNILLGYPEISLITILVLVFVGRFTGLQLLEYIRFMPLIKHYFEEE